MGWGGGAGGLGSDRGVTEFRVNLMACSCRNVVSKHFALDKAAVLFVDLGEGGRRRGGANSLGKQDITESPRMVEKNQMEASVVPSIYVS